MADRTLEMMLEGMRQAEMQASERTELADLPFYSLAQVVSQAVSEADSSMTLLVDSIWCAVQAWLDASLSAGRAFDTQFLMQHPVWVFPVGVLVKGETASLRELVSGIVRHAGGDDVTIELAFAAALNTRFAAQGVPASAWIAALHQELGEVFELNLLRIGHVLSWGSEQHAIRHLSQPAGKGTILAQALYAILRHHSNAGAMLRQALSVREQAYLVALWTGIMALD